MAEAREPEERGGLSGTVLFATGAVMAAALALLALVARSRRAVPAPLPATAPGTYEADPEARATCVHLRPIEDEARDQAVRCVLAPGPPASVFVDALDPGPAAMAPLRLVSCVRHEDTEVVGPHTFSDPVYRCTRCGSAVAFHQGGYGNDPPPLNIRPRTDSYS